MAQVKSPWSLSAEEEYQRDSRLKREDVKSLQEWISTQEHFPSLDEEMILHLIHACYYDAEKVKVTAENLYTMKNTMPDFFNDWDIHNEHLQRMITECMTVAHLPGSDAEGNRVVICKIRHPDPAKYDYTMSVKWILMTCFYSLWHHGIQKGCVLVYDSDGFTMSHLFKIPIGGLRNYLKFGETASPIRVVKIVFINSSVIVKKFVSFIKPFLSKDVFNMVSVHTSPEYLFKILPKDIIPEDYGGSAPPLISLHRELVDNVSLYREWMLEEEKIRCDESKRGKKLKNSPTKTAKATIRELEID